MKNRFNFQESAYFSWIIRVIVIEVLIIVDVKIVVKKHGFLYVEQPGKNDSKTSVTLVSLHDDFNSSLSQDLSSIFKFMCDSTFHVSVPATCIQYSQQI